MPKYRRGSGSVYKKRGVFYTAYYTPDGKQVCESARTKDKAEARRILQARLGQLAEGRYVGPATERMTCDQLTALVVNDYKTTGKKALRELLVRINKHLAPFFVGKRACDIVTADVQAFIVKRQEENASPGEINRELAILKRGFNLAIRTEQLIKKPYIPHLAEHNVRQGFFEVWEFERLLSKLPDYLRPPLTFAYWTGWRLHSEVFSLTWSLVDLEAGTVRLLPGTTKNGEGRVVFLTPELKALLMQQWTEFREQYPRNPYVFLRFGQRIKNIRGAWDRACKEAGLVGKIPHDLRRTAVRNMVRVGIPERVAMQLSGHKTRDVFDRYNIVSEGDLQEAAKKLGRLSSPQTTTLLTTLPTMIEEQSHLSH